MTRAPRCGPSATGIVPTRLMPVQALEKAHRGPRHRLDPEQVREDDRVRTLVTNDQDTLFGIRHVPDSVTRVVSDLHPMRLGQQILDSAADSLVEVPKGLSAGHPRPLQLQVSRARLAEKLLDLVRGLPLHLRESELLEPGDLLCLHAERLGDRLGRLDSSPQRAHVQVVEALRRERGSGPVRPAGGRSRSRPDGRQPGRRAPNRAARGGPERPQSLERSDGISPGRAG